MSKLAIAAMLLAAFFYAAYLYRMRKPLPEIGCGRLRRRFLFATLVFIGFMSQMYAHEPVISCYAESLRPLPPQTPLEKFKSSFASAWAAFDSQKTEDFDKILDEAVKQRVIPYGSSVYFKVGYRSMASYRQYFEGKGKKEKLSALDVKVQLSCMNWEEKLETLLDKNSKVEFKKDIEIAIGEIASELEFLKALSEKKENVPAKDQLVPTKEAMGAATIIVFMRLGNW